MLKENVKPEEVSENSPAYDALANMPDKDEYLAGLGNYIQDIMKSGDSVAHILVRPGSYETFIEWFYTYQLHENLEIEQQLRQQIQVAPNDMVDKVQVVTRSQAENQWLMDHFKAMGVLNYMQTKRIPGSLVSAEMLRIMLAVEMVVNCMPNSISTATKFDPASMNLKTK